MHKDVPTISLEALPAEEQTGGIAINSNLQSLSSYLDQYAAAVALFDYAGQFGPVKNPIEFRWRFIAVRDGAMTIYHFASVLNAFQGLLADHPSIAATVDQKSLQAALDGMNQHFPDRVEIRQAVAHTGDHSKTPERVADHTTTDPTPVVTPGEPVYSRGNIFDGQWGATYRKKWVSYALSKESLGHLEAIALLVFKAFKPVAEATKELRLKALEQKRAQRRQD